MTTRLVIVQPYVPTYRVTFFEGLLESLAKKNIDCIVAAGAPARNQAKRGDSVVREWQVPIKIKAVPVGGRTIDVAISPSPWRHTDAVIMDLKGASLPLYDAMIQCRLRNVRLGLWGHVRPYVNTGNPMGLWLEKIQMNIADHIFAYTAGGAHYAVERGIDAKKITTLMNTVDTSALEQRIRALSREDIRVFAGKHGIDPRRTISFIGGLDSSKRIDFLAIALDLLWHRDRSVKILIGGQGADEHYLRTAYERGQAVALGYADDNLKALILKSSRAVCMPGRIGLVAVDALVAQRKIITTDWPFHAPEWEYLEEGLTKVTVKDDPVAYAEGILDYLSAEQDAEFVPSRRQYPILADMIDRFSRGVSEMLAN